MESSVSRQAQCPNGRIFIRKDLTTIDIDAFQTQEPYIVMGANYMIHLLEE